MAAGGGKGRTPESRQPPCPGTAAQTETHQTDHRTADRTAAAAQTAATAIARHSAETPALFEARETDPKSEAKPAIWADFADFTAKADALESAALEISETLTTPDELVPSVQRLGQACKACHSLYRE